MSAEAPTTEELLDELERRQRARREQEQLARLYPGNINVIEIARQRQAEYAARQRVEAAERERRAAEQREAERATWEAGAPRRKAAERALARLEPKLVAAEAALLALRSEAHRLGEEAKR